MSETLQTKEYVFKTYDGDKPIHATVYYNEESRDKPSPIALAIHGGAYCVGTRHMVPKPQIEYLVRHNLTVVSVDHRLCPNVSWEEGPRQDTIDAYHWCRNQLPVLLKQDTGVELDGNSVVTFGHSSGAHLSLLLGGEEPRPKALLDFYGTLYLNDPFWYKPLPVPVKSLPPREFLDQVHDLPVETTHNADKIPKDKETGMDVRTLWMAEKIKKGTLISDVLPKDKDPCDTVKRFSKDFPPTYFSIGSEDNRRSLPLFQKAYDELKELGVEVVLKVIEGVGHAYDVELKEGDELWYSGVQQGLDFLIAHV